MPQPQGQASHTDTVAISNNAVITSPGNQPLELQTGTFTGTDAATYTNFSYYQSLIYFSAGGLTNNGSLTYSNVSSALGNSTYLTQFDTQIGTAPGVTGNFNRYYYWGCGAYLYDGNVNYWGGPVTVWNGMAGNTNVNITATVGGTNQAFAAGVDVWAYYGNSTNPGITEVNYGTITGRYTGTGNGAAAGIYNLTDYGGQNITNFAPGTITASAPYYADAVFAWCDYGNVNAVQNGTVTGAATGGQQGNTAGIANAVGMDLFTYSTTNTASINLLNTVTVTATATATATTNISTAAVFCWAQGGPFTFTNTGTLISTGNCTATPLNYTVLGFYGGSAHGPVNLYNSGSVTAIAGTGGGGWAYGTENDTGNAISVVNTGTISHNTGLGLFIYGTGGGTATVTNSGTISGGNEGIAAEHYTGNLTIYDTGTVQGGTANYNTMDLGATNATVTVHLYGLPNIVGWMNGLGASNVLDFHLQGILQKVNGATPTLGTNLAAYTFGLTGGNIYVDPSATVEGLNGALDTLRNGGTPVGADLKLGAQPGDPKPKLIDIYHAFCNECGTSLDQQCDSDSWWYRMPGSKKPECWGQAAQLTRTVGGQEKPIFLIYIAGCPLNAYQKFFIDGKVTPSLVVIGDAYRDPDPQPGAERQQAAERREQENICRYNDWLAEFSWDGKLGELIRHNQARLPTLAAVPTVLGWPTNPSRYVFPEDFEHA